MGIWESFSAGVVGLYNLAEAEDDGGQLLASASLISHQRTAGGSQILLRG